MLHTPTVHLSSTILGETFCTKRGQSGAEFPGGHLEGGQPALLQRVYSIQELTCDNVLKSVLLHPKKQHLQCMFTHHPRAGSLDVDASVELVQSEVLCSRSFCSDCLLVGLHETSLLKPTTDFWWWCVIGGNAVCCTTALSLLLCMAAIVSECSL